MEQTDTRKLDCMRAGGQALGKIKQALHEFTHEGTTFAQIEAEAQRLIAQAGMKPSFSTVPGYDWATCVMKNDALCHGIPGDQVVENGDIITIDVGLINQGYHLDTTITFPVGTISSRERTFLEIGQRALNKSISLVKPGQSVYQLSRAMEKTTLEAGYGVVYQLTGHGVGEELHMEPAIPCVAVPQDKAVHLTVNQTIAVEIMYTMGSPDLVTDADGWTYRTKDRSISAMFEETVLVTATGHEVLTKSR